MSSSHHHVNDMHVHTQQSPRVICTLASHARFFVFQYHIAILVHEADFTALTTELSTQRGLATFSRVQTTIVLIRAFNAGRWRARRHAEALFVVLGCSA
jgi:hypothetical protein